MISNKTLLTIVSRTIIAVANFFLVVFSAQIWGNEGRGIIALVFANISMIIILNNITSGSTIAYHAPKLSKNSIFSTVLTGTLITSLVGSIIVAFIIGFQYVSYLFIIALLISYASSLSLYWLGTKNINFYNIFSVLPPVLILGFLTLIYYDLKVTNIEIFYYSYYLSYGAVLVAGIILLFGKTGFKFKLNISDAKKIFHYGVKSETSYFFQFLNYRASYFFISAWLGLGSLGLFSVAIALTEAIWIISKSISSVHYSNIINTDDPVQRIKLTEKAALNSFLFSFAAIIIIYFIPEDIFTYAFGKDFTGIKPLIVYMFPGVIAIAISNIYGHYFSGIGKMNILIIKSLLGLILTIAFIFILLKKYELTGACIILNISYITSSLYLYFMFRKEKKKIIAQ